MLPSTSAAPEPIPFSNFYCFIQSSLPASVTFFPKSDKVAFADSAVLFRAVDALVPSSDTVGFADWLALPKVLDMFCPTSAV